MHQIDFRRVNAVTRPDCYPLPRIEDCIDRVGGAKFVITLDLSKGCWQVPLTARAKEMSPFIPPWGLFSYSVMPFGLPNAPATFQCLVNTVLAGLDGCSSYLDDVVVFSETWGTHVQRWCAVLDRLTEVNSTVAFAKWRHTLRRRL